ncbi:MAG: hypothetical protein LAT55_03200 [Opitutales bacterium]|nr:hypothetical protein [Opitutales bacterium]
MRIHLNLFAFLASSTALLATPPPPTADSLNSGLLVHYDDGTESFHLTWWGIDTHYYFIEQTEDLKNWSFVPTVEEGADDPLAMAFQISADRWFWRVRYSNDPESDLLAADYNGIFLSAWDQLQLGYNPFDWVDTDENDLHDAWEMHYFGALGVDSEGDPNNTGLTNADAFVLGADPTTDESADPALRENFTYDDRGWMSGYQPAAGDALTYAFDAEGNLTAAQ